MKEKIEKIGKNKFILIGGFLVIILLILLGSAFIYHTFFYKMSFSEIESVMVDTAKKHMKKNENILPKNYNETVSLSVNDLARAEEMKDIKEYLKDDSISCTGNIIVTKINDNYFRYTPNLDCGETYKTNKFIDYIKSKNPIVTNGNGLYELNEELVFRGDNVNNYLQLSDKLYRIVKFSSNEAIIIYTDKTEATIWDDRYNLEKTSNVGINNYDVSKIKDYLDNLYQGTTLLGIDKATGFNYKNLVVAYQLNIGKRSSKDTDKSGKLEMSAVMENQFIGLLPLNDFINASLDKDCTTSISPSCQNYNYLSKFQNNWWTGTATNLNSYNVYRIETSPKLVSANSTAHIRPVLHLTRDALYVSGDGTKTNPYVIK